MKYITIVFLSILLSCENSINDIPLTCTFVTPQENAVISNEVPVNINVTTQTPADKVEFYFDDEIISTMETSPYEFTWTPRGRAEGNHVIRAVATRWHEEAVATAHVFINYTLGSTSQGGTIYYIDETGRHGLIVANHDLNYSNQNEHSWGPEIFMAAADSVNGQANTTTLANTPGMDSYFWKLFKLGYTHNGYSDWYVPSKKEFQLLADCMDELGTSSAAYLQDTYWTSTECCRSQACAFNFNQKKAITVLKADSVFRVRPVRKF